MKEKLLNIFTEEEEEDNKPTSKKKFIIFCIIYILIIVLCIIDFPYYIDAPGGLEPIGDNITIENQYKSKGSINLTYVTEYPGKLPLLVIAYFNEDWTIVSKNEDKMGTLDYESTRIRGIYTSRESYSTSVIYALKKANKEVKILEHKVYATYIFEEAKTDIKVGDQILKIDDVEIKNYYTIRDIIKEHKPKDKLKVEVLNNKKKYIREVELIEFENETLIGLGFNVEYIFESNPKVTINYNSREMGPSGGLMLALYTYNSLVKEDITGGKTIVGTGTLDIDGNVGPIGGIEYKLKGAVKKKADVFFAPSGENYEEAMKLKKKRGYKIEIVEVKTFDDALNYLLNNVVKK